LLNPFLITCLYFIADIRISNIVYAYFVLPALRQYYFDNTKCACLDDLIFPHSLTQPKFSVIRQAADIALIFLCQPRRKIYFLKRIYVNS